MGLASLIKVAQGKNAANVSFEDSFLREYEAAVKREEKAQAQPYPKHSFRPSSMYGCERMLFFSRMYAGTGRVEDNEPNLTEICDSGTDRHLRIQKLVADMEGVKTLDLEEVVKEANARGINTEFLGWNEDKTEARCKNEDLSIYFQPDGVLNFMGKDVILEIKTESTYQFSNRYEPKEDHKYQATCYGMGLGIDYVLFLYEDRNFCNKKAYLWKITDAMKEKVKDKIAYVNKAIEAGVPPHKDTNKCTYCDYKTECQLADMNKWKAPEVAPEKPRKPQKAVKEPKPIKSTTKDNRGNVERLRKAPKCGTCKHCVYGKGRGAYVCNAEGEHKNYDVDRRRKCWYKSSKWEAKDE